MTIQTFGIAISARWFDVAHAEAVRRFANTSAGIQACLAWLATFGTPVRVGMEATGSSHLLLASALHAAGHVVLVCHPLSIARYSQAVLARTKTDATDARRIARFCQAHELVSVDASFTHSAAAARAAGRSRDAGPGALASEQPPACGRLHHD